MVKSPITRTPKGQKIVQLMSLASRPDGVRVHDAMAQLDLDERGFRRYLADLRTLGIPLHDEGRGANRVIRVDSAYHRERVTLTLSEVLALRLGRSLVTFLDGTAFADDLDDALLRLAPTIHNAHEHIVSNLDEVFLAIPEPRKCYTGEATADVIDEIVTALIYCNPIDASYGRPQHNPRDYRLHPLTLATYRSGLYLLALDEADESIKTFSVERFHTVKRARRERFERPMDFNPNTFTRDAFGIVGGPPETVHLRFRPPLADYATERIWHHSQRTQTTDDGATDLIMQVAVTAELMAWVRSLGPAVLVLSPDSLRERILDDARAWLAQAHPPA